MIALLGAGVAFFVIGIVVGVFIKCLIDSTEI